MNIIVFPLFKNCINTHEFVKLYYFTKFAEKKVSVQYVYKNWCHIFNTCNSDL